MADLPGPIAVVCHDAGAANIILAWLEQVTEEVRPFMAGPAASLWQTRFPGRPLFGSVDEALSGAASLLTGSGCATDIEHRARAAARRLGLKTVAVVDHWVNYRARFERDGIRVLPDEIWVTDTYALAMARRELPDALLRLEPNPYLEEQVRRIRPRPGGETGDVLYVLEPFRESWGSDRPAELQALDYFMAARERLGIAPGTPIRLRLHPTERAAKYAAWIAEQDDPAIRLDTAGDMADAINGADWVIGCQSYALVIALRAGRRVVSALPPNAPACLLPMDGIIHLRALAEPSAKPCSETEKS
jgi:hypothetical protein